MPVESQRMSFSPNGVVVEISQEARDYNKSITGIEEAKGIEGCQTCKNRRYVDESSDSSVSYQTPTHIGPEQAAGKVAAHEREHITNDKARAEQKDRRVISQSVSLSTSICPECGKMYVSGGTARTVTASGKKSDAQDTAPENLNNTSETGETNA